jgi:transposase InsO family protein
LPLNHAAAIWVARQITEAIAWIDAPSYVVRDRDAIDADAVDRRLRAIGIRGRPTAPRSPWQNGHAERVNGSIRRKCLDHIVVVGEARLRRVLKAYPVYHNTTRTRLSLDKDVSLHRSIQGVGRIASVEGLGGLHHQYARI